jgi:MFS family permease
VGGRNIQDRRAGGVQGFVLLLPVMLAVMATAALAPALPQLHAAFADVAGEQWLVPMVLTTPALCLIIFAPIAGVLGDRFGRRPLLICSLIVYALLGMAPLVLDDLVVILMSRVGVGIAEAFALTLSTIMISDYFTGRERDKWLGYQVGFGAVSAIFLVAIGGALGEFGWRGPFAIYALPLLFALLILLLTWEPVRNTQVVDNQVAQRSAAFPWRLMVSILAITLFASVTFYVAQIQNGVALVAVGLREPKVIGMMIALSALGTLAGSVVFRFIAARPLAQLLLISFACIAVGYAGVGIAQNAQSLTASMALAQFGCGIVLPSVLTFTVRNLPLEVRGRGTGMWQGVFSIGQFLSPILVTLSANQLGGILPAFALFAALNMAAAVLALVGGLIVGKGASLSDPTVETSNRRAV